MAAPLRLSFLRNLLISSGHSHRKANEVLSKLSKHFGTTVENLRSWQLHSAVYLQRYPAITCEMTSMEKKYKDYVDKIDLNESLLSNHEITIKREKSGVKADTLSALDYEDQWQSTYDNFKFAPRVTEADNTNDTTSVKRKLSEKLFLIVKYNLENSKPVWGLPALKVNQGESMREAAERALSTKCGEEVAVTFLGNAPCGYSSYKLPHSFSEYGVKQFFFKAIYNNGDVSAEDNISEYKWVTLKESKDFLDPRVHKEITKFDMDF